MNPYTHEMDIFVGNPDPQPNTVNFRQTEVEVDDNYPGTWAFKGESQRVNRSIRIKYRYPKRSQDGKTVLCWLDDYLLIGYEGGGGA
jgi:hypothetical protein